MQTFLAYADYAKSAAVLDPSRLGNQFYREGLTILRGGWPNHPVSKMWRGYRYHLCLYLLACFEELRQRGRYYPKHAREVMSVLAESEVTGAPSWLGDPAFHASHRSNLLRKDPVWYGQFGWTEAPDLPYVWPV